MATGASARGEQGPTKYGLLHGYSQRTLFDESSHIKPVLLGRTCTGESRQVKPGVRQWLKPQYDHMNW